MAAYLVSYSTASEQIRANLDEFMAALGAVPIADCLCGLEIELDLEAFRRWLTGQLEERDALVVIELCPRLGQANQNLSKEAAVWLEQQLQPR